jgi:large subunit ribosomal protein L25
MAEKKLEASPREDTGKGAARKLRAVGKVPAVVYGRGIDPIRVSVDSRELFHVLHTDAGMNVLIDLQIDGDTHLALAKEVQRDIVRGEFLHADFFKISRTEKITVKVPIEILGAQEAPGVKEGGVVEHHLWEIELECLPTNVPSSIEADIGALEVNDSLKVSDLTVPESVEFITPEDEMVVAVVPPPIMKLEEEEAAEEGAEAEEGEAAAEGEERAEAETGTPGGETSTDEGSEG